MSNLTRIKNNQVTDSTIVASAKLVPGSVTGGLLSDPISYSGSMTISGNLTVQGTTTTVDTINTLVADPVIVLSKGETGSPSNDSGFLIERGTSSNAAFLWDETNDRFSAIITTNDGLGGGTITPTSWADLKIANLITSGISNTGTTNLNSISNVTITGGSDAQVMTTYGNGVVYWGNVAAGNVGELQFRSYTTGALESSNVLTFNGSDIEMVSTGFDSLIGPTQLSLSNKITGYGTTVETNQISLTNPLGGVFFFKVKNNNSSSITWNLPDTNGSSGYVLTTDGSANLNWSASTTITSVGTLTSLDVNAQVNATVFSSNISTGTAPFTVISTTQVANLNAASAGTAVTVTSASQPNITSLGNLSIANIDNIQINNNTISSTDTNGNIILLPNGTGDIYLTADTLILGDNDAAVILTTNGTGNLFLSTNNDTNSGNINLAQGINGNITITANGTGEVVTNTLAISDLTSGRVVLAGNSGAVVDNGNLTFSGTLLSITGDVFVTGATDISNIRISSNDIISTNTNGNISITPNGTGDINLGADTITIGDANSEATVTTNGTGNLFLSTNAGTNSGNIKIAQGLNSNISITANGSGEVVTNTLAVSDLTSGRFVLAGTNGALQDSSAFSYSGSDLTVSGDLAVNGGDITTTAVTANIVNANATTVNFASAATTLEIGAATGTTNINNNLDVDGNINLDGANFTTTAATVNLANANTTTLNLGGAATAVNIGASTGTTIVKNDLQVDGGDITFGAATTANIANATVTSLNLGGAATTVEIGAATGTTNVNNNLDVDGNVNMDGSNFTVTAGTVNIANANATTVNFAGAATTLELGAATGTTNVNNNLDVDGNINLDGANFTVTASTVNIANANATTVNFAGAATTVEIGAATGTTNINNDLDVDGNINLDGANFTTTAATVNIANANTTTLNLGGAATTLNLGASTGTTKINNDLQIMGNDIKASTGNTAITLSDIDVTIAGNLTVQGITTNIGTADLVVEDSLIRLHTTANLAPLTSDDGRDVGIVFHYYKTSNKEAGLVWANDTGALEYYSDATESIGGTFAGTYGNIKAASFFSNVADGTAPFTVNSTTRVANLNVAASGIANTVVDAAQPNITSVGNLTIVNVDNIQINDNTISTTNSNGNLILATNGTGDVQMDADTVRIGDAGFAATLTTNGTANLLLSTNEGTNSGNIVIVNGVDGNINITPNGTGDINLAADNVVVGDANATGTITTNGTGSLFLSTNSGTDSGNIQITQGVNGNISITANGSGEINLNTLAVGDLTSGRVTYASTNGSLIDSANLTFNGTVLGITGNVTVSNTANLGNIRVSGNDIISTNTDGNVNITPNGTGDINLSADNVVVGDSNSTGTITTSGTGNLVLNTNAGTNSGNIAIAQGINGNITITANGTGEVVTNTLAVSDLTSGRVTLASTNGALADNANLTFSGTLLTVTGNANVTGTANIGNIQLTDSTITGLQIDTAITITPNGTGDINLSADTVVVGDLNALATVTTNGAGNLLLTTNGGSNSGNIQIAQGTNGNVTITANGTGEVVTNTLAVSDLTSGRVVYAGTNGALTDSTAFTYDGTALAVTGNLTISDTANLGNIRVSDNDIISTNSNGNINITPDGTGDINLAADNVVVGDSNASATITTNGTGTLTINTNAGVSSGNIILTQGSNGNINVTANGTGEIILNTLAVTDLSTNSIPYIGANNALVESSNLTFTGTLLTVTGNANVSNTANIGNIQITGNTISSTDGNGNVNITPNGTGDINLGADAIILGDLNTEANLTTNGSGNLIISTNSNTDSSNIKIAAGLNGNINITAHGTGEIIASTLAVSDLLNTRVVFAGPNGALVDDAGLTYSAGTLSVNGDILANTSVTVGNIYITDNTITSVNTNGNVNIEANGTGDVVINTSGDNSDFYVYGNTSTYMDAVIYTKASSGQVGIRTESPAAGAALHINSVDAMIIPTGGTGDRPLTPATGMLRFNTTTNFVEFFNGLTWESTAGSFTVINYENFVGDGSTTIFTMAGGSTTAGTIVAINGSLQQPGTAYSISGTTLTFTSAPTLGNQIDVRRLTTTTTIVEIAEGDTIVRVTDNGSDGTVNLIADGTTIVSVTNALVVSSGNVRPNANLTLDLGASDYRWQDIFAGNVDLSGNIALSGSITTAFTPNANLTLDLGGSSNRWQDIYGGNLDLSGNIALSGSITTAFTPNANLTLDLGASDYRWQDLFAGNVDLSGNLAVAGSITTALTPNANLTLDLGGSSNRWQDIYGGNLDLSGNLAVSGSITTALIPNANNSIDLGSGTYRWQDVYAVSVDINGTPAATTDDATALAIVLG